MLIPAYEPHERLVHLVAELRRSAPDLGVLVVDDGSGPAYRRVFDAARAAGATVLAHTTNRGKGSALRTGFAHLARNHPGHDVVCADCDGQHSVVDVLRVAGEVARGDAAVVLGARRFTGDVPARSRLGNTVTRQAFRLATGLRVQDTQTGLRGYPAAMLGWLLSVGGDRFEYELSVLLRAAAAGYAVREVEIATIYLAGNESSHFRPLVDSVRVVAPLLRFTASSLTAFTVDLVALLALHAATGSLLVSVVGARLVSAALNFAVNRRLVFARGADTPLGVAAVRYTLLAVTLLAGSYVLLRGLTGAGLGLLPAKLVTELVLFGVSYRVQRGFVFGHRGRSPVVPAGPGVASPARARHNAGDVQDVPDCSLPSGGDLPR